MKVHEAIQRIAKLDEGFVIGELETGIWYELQFRVYVNPDDGDLYLDDMQMTKDE